MEVKLQNLLNWQIYRSCWEKERFLAHLRLAEEVGFEPTDEDHSSTVFKTAAFNRSPFRKRIELYAISHNWQIAKKMNDGKLTPTTLTQVSHLLLIKAVPNRHLDLHPSIRNIKSRPDDSIAQLLRGWIQGTLTRFLNDWGAGNFTACVDREFR